ncbi:UDP-glucose dehydrogenase family protein [Methylovulum psychrotolerans]|uniref:UDP-glucose 6-dehydrogenase n=1 Tax=Methylovulum psychrotolerans TaxID=1704499 RepID=A0A1Z4BV49_9GAMM|nr:UDP-glucose/GDP-mannose dehydrogenase family protein [Methylovulum psychrotolerans]ASF45089.1 UDP-glucose 6-dehydrogenase [Methylovulum psychrotolerans]POZ51057.1 UDP-glucose/GDP-mannose dehydrogenase family protein [Methylovulum psychrotolerans]
MKVTVFGSGYVGLVTGVCLAEVGNDVLCIDVDEAKIANLRQGIVPIFEPGLEDMVKDNQRAGRLKFTTHILEAVAHGVFQFIAVGTPPDEDGGADLQYVLAVAKSIAENMMEYRVIVDKSTVPVGTADRVKAVIEQVQAARVVDVPYDVVSNPEFLKEGAAIDDFMKPDRIIIGTDNPKAEKLLKALYAPFNRNHERIITMDVRSAELTKYAANAMLATKISFMNELANLAERLGADIEKVRNGIGSDSRIGYSFIYPGCGYGGSCFPKDVKALEHTAQQMGYEAELLQAVENVNNRQKQVLFSKVSAHYHGDLQGKTFAMWGLAFKPKTDDMREAPSRVILEALIAAGASVRAYDPEAMLEAKRIYGDKPGLTLVESAEEALTDANALLVVTEWKNFWSPDFDLIKASLKDGVIFDGRNLYKPELLKEMGFTYYGIGRA